MKPLLLDLPLEAHQTLRGGYFTFSVRETSMATHCRPGMFFEVKSASPDQERRLFKPLSVYGVSGDSISFLARIAGPGTAALAELRAGDPIRLLGPLGNSFPVIEGARALLVSGGVGYPPLAYLRKSMPADAVCFLIHGGACADDVFPCDKAYTEDGSSGIAGRVTKDVLSLISEKEITVVYSCGPLPMLKALSDLVAPLPHYASLEAYMACGIGVCHGCAVPVGDTYKRVCADGPVFLGSDIRWEEL